MTSFREYYAAMPWLAIPQGDPRKERLSTALAIEGIPRLVLLHVRTGRVLHQDARGRVGDDPTGAHFPWRDDGAEDGDYEDDEEDDEGMMMVAGPGDGREPPKREVEAQKEEERIREVIQDDEGGKGGEGGMTVEAALAEACVELGYDEGNPKRKELITKLRGCEGSKDFPEDIMAKVCQKTGRKKHEVLDELREQVLGVIESMREAIKQAEDEQYKADAPIREKIKQMALCPAGFDWHREGCGWRCNGGSHYVSNDDIPNA